VRKILILNSKKNFIPFFGYLFFSIQKKTRSPLPYSIIHTYIYIVSVEKNGCAFLHFQFIELKKSNFRTFLSKNTKKSTLYTLTLTLNFQLKIYPSQTFFQTFSPMRNRNI
jgi:hypothetical protein